MSEYISNPWGILRWPTTSLLNTITAVVGVIGLTIAVTTANQTAFRIKDYAGRVSMYATGSGSLTMSGTLRVGSLNCTGGGNGGKLTTDSAGNISCSDDVGSGTSTGNVIGLSDARYVKKQGDTMTGTLIINLTTGTLGFRVIQTASGNIIHAEKNLTSSGTLTIVGIGRFKNALQFPGTATGNILHTEKSLSSSGTLTVLGVGRFQNNVNVVGTISGAALQIMNGNSYFLGNLGIGKSTAPKANIDVSGTMSGNALYVARSFSGAGLVACSNSTTSKLLWSGGQFSCGTDQNTGLTFSGAEGIYVNQAGDTMTGALTINVTGGIFSTVGLKVIQTASGASLHAEKTLTSSGTLVVTGNAKFGSTLTQNGITYTYPITQGVGLFLKTDGAGTLTWATPTTTFGTGNVLTIGDVRYLRTSGGTMTGAEIVNITGGNKNTVGINVLNEVSGAVIHANTALTSSGTLTVKGSTYLKNTPSCSILQSDSTSLLSCNNTSYQTTSLTDDNTLVGSAGGSATQTALPSCSAANSCLQYNTSTNAFACTTPAGTTYVAGKGLTLGGNSFKLNATLTGTTLRGWSTISGSSLQADSTLASSGTLTVNKTAKFNGTLTGTTIIGTTLSGTFVRAIQFSPRMLGIEVVASGSTITTGSGKDMISIPQSMSGFYVSAAQATVMVSGTTNSTTLQVRDANKGNRKIFSTPVTILTATTVDDGTYVIAAANNTVSTGDRLLIDIPAVSTTAPKVLQLILTFTKP